MWIAGLCYTGYLIRSSKINFVQEILKSVSNRLRVGDIVIAQNFIQSSCYSFLSKLLNELRVSLVVA